MTKRTPRRSNDAVPATPLTTKSAQLKAEREARADREAADPFLRLDQLVRYRIHSTGELASAIIQHGIYGWDRYGRFGFFEPQSVDAQRALDALAAAHAIFPHDVTFASDDFLDLPLSDFGWRSSVCPDFESLSPGDAPAPQRKAPDKRAENANLALIGALLLALKGKIGDSSLYGSEKEDPLINIIVDEVKGFGLKKRTLQDKFARAKQLVEVTVLD